MPPATTHCDQCGKKFSRYASMLRGAHSFCSRKCAKEHRRNSLVSLVCAQCGTTFKRRKSLVRGKQSFCSRKCSQDYFSEHPHHAGGRAPYDPDYRVIASGRRVKLCYIEEARTIIAGQPYLVSPQEGA